MSSASAPHMPISSAECACRRAQLRGTDGAPQFAAAMQGCSSKRIPPLMTGCALLPGARARTLLAVPRATPISRVTYSEAACLASQGWLRSDDQLTNRW